METKSKVTKNYENIKDNVQEKVKIFKVYKLEKEVEKEIKKIYTALGWDCYGIQSKLGCPGGVADLVLIKDGKIMFIEVKSPAAFNLKNHNLSKNQIKFLKEAGGYVATIINEKITMELVK